MKYRVIASAFLIIGLFTGCAHQRYTDNYSHTYPNQYPDSYSTNDTRGYAPGYQGRQDYYPPASQPSYQSSYIEQATIVDVREIVTGGEASGAGTALGALIGGVLGHQVGKGNGNDLATIGGAIAGGVIGNQVERNNAAPGRKTELTLQMRNGERRTILVDGYRYRVGDQVSVTFRNGQLQLM